MVRKKTLRSVLASLAMAAGLLAAGPAVAALVDFEGVAAPNTQNTDDGVTRAFNGYNVFVPHGHYQGIGFLQPDPRPSSGSDWLLHDHFAATLGQPVVVTRVGGGAFSVQSIDAAEWDNGFDKQQELTLTGHLSGGGTIVQTFVTDLFDGFQTFIVTGFDDIVQLDIIGSTFGTTFGTLGYDNVVVNDVVVGGVPEPTTAGLLALGLGLLASKRRRAAY